MGAPINQADAANGNILQADGRSPEEVTALSAVGLVQATLALAEVQEAGNRIAAAGVIAQLRREAIESRRAGMISVDAADRMFAKTNDAILAFLDEHCGDRRP